MVTLQLCIIRCINFFAVVLASLLYIFLDTGVHACFVAIILWQFTTHLHSTDLFSKLFNVKCLTHRLLLSRREFRRIIFKGKCIGCAFFCTYDSEILTHSMSARFVEIFSRLLWLKVLTLSTVYLPIFQVVEDEIF